MSGQVSPNKKQGGCGVLVKQFLGLIFAVACIAGCISAVIDQVSGHSDRSSQSKTSGSQTHVTATPAATATLGPSPKMPTPSPTPTHAPRWTTIQTFKGYGNKKTPTFNVPNRWQLIWSCDPASDGGEYNLFVDVYRPDGTPVDLGAIFTTCQPDNTHDSTQEYRGGTVYLDVQSTGAWTIQVEVFK